MRKKHWTAEHGDEVVCTCGHNPLRQHLTFECQDKPFPTHLDQRLGNRHRSMLVRLAKLYVANDRYEEDISE